MDHSFKLAIDTAVMELIEDDEFRSKHVSYGFLFPIPECPQGFETDNFYNLYPAKLNFSKSEITMCYENDTTSIWGEFHQYVASKITSNLNKRYDLKLKLVIKTLDTSVEGYFETLKNVVDNGMCDVCVSATNHDEVRAEAVNFQCPIGSSSPGFLRSSFDPSIKINSIKDLDQSNITVIVYGDTTFDKLAMQYLQKAKIVRVNSGYTELYKLILDRKAHAMIDSVQELSNWLTSHRSECGSSCFIRGFGEPFSYGTFVTNRIYASGAFYISLPDYWTQILLLSLLFLMI
ncbi:hypothetical protein ABK040_016456 [Willaertia magna]